MNLPEEYLSRIKRLLPDDYEDYLADFHRTYGQTFRVNQLKVQPADFICRFAGLSPVPWCPNGFYTKDEKKLSHSPFYAAGLFYLQEPSAMAPAEFLPVKKGDRVLDLCAAPGGKSVALAGKLGGEGLLVSNDISASRCQALLKNMEMAGAPNIMITCETPDRLARAFPEYFDCILVDAPCSGEGMFRKDPSMCRRWSPEAVQKYSRIQEALVLQAAGMLRPGGYLLYATCTYEPEENEQIAEKFLNVRKDFSICSLPLPAGVSRGLWEQSLTRREDLANCRRFWSHRLEGEGQFAALFQREGASAQPVRHREEARNRGVFPDRDQTLTPELKDFLARIKVKVPAARLYRQQERVFLLPEISVQDKKLRFIRSGLYLGDCKKKRFEPSQALAMALKGDQFPNALLLEAGDERLDRYLRGETIMAEGLQDGWVLLCVEGYPLGWGKAVRGVIKNKYTPGWRRV